MPGARFRTSPRVSSIARRVPTFVYVLLGVGVVAGLVAVTGGLATVEDAPVARVSLGEIVEGRQLDVTIDGAWLADGIDLVTDPAEGNRFLAVEVTVTNVSDTPANTLDDNVLVEGVVGVSDRPEADRVLILGESANTPTFQPGVSQSALLVWEVPAASLEKGDELAVSVLDKTFTPGFLFDDSWADPTVSAIVPVTLGDRARQYISDDDEFEFFTPDAEGLP